MTLYRDMDRIALDAAYNNAAAVPQSAQFMADWQARSDAFVATVERKHLDLRYGDAERSRIDYFSAGSRGPVLVFIHGGGWQLREKERFRFLAAGPLAHGIDVALVGYTLAPQKRLNDIVAEIRAAVTWIAANAAQYGGDAKQIYLSGWSAGAHLAAMGMAEPAVRGGLAISGIFDLEPVRLSYLNDKLQLDDAEARRNSPLLNLPKTSSPLTIVYGSAELLEFQRQSEEFGEAWLGAGLPGTLTALSGHNHYTILEALADPKGALTKIARRVCGLGVESGLVAVSHET